MSSIENAKTKPYLIVKEASSSRIRKVVMPSEAQIGLDGNATFLSVFGSLSLYSIDLLATRINDGVLRVVNDASLVNVIFDSPPSSGRITVILPDKPRPGQICTVKDYDGLADVYPIDIVTPNGGTIDGEVQKTIDSTYGSVVLYNESGEVWRVLLATSGVTGEQGPTGPKGLQNAMSIIREEIFTSSSYWTIQEDGEWFFVRATGGGGGGGGGRWTGSQGDTGSGGGGGCRNVGWFHRSQISGSRRWWFDGIDDTIDHGTDQIFEQSPTSSFSIGLNFQTMTPTCGLVGKKDNTPNSPGYYVGLQSGKLIFTLQETPASLLSIVSERDFNTGDEYNVLVSYTGSPVSSSIEMYVNGAAVRLTGSVETLNVTSSIVTTSSFRYGVVGTHLEPRGMIRNVSFWTSALTASNAVEFYGGGSFPDLNLLPSTPQPYLWAKVDADSDVPGVGGIVDHGVGGNDGTAIGEMFPATHIVTVGSGGLGGEGRNSQWNQGVADFGQNGGNTFFGLKLLSAYGGGRGGTTVATSGTGSANEGGSGGGAMGPGRPSTGSGATVAQGGAPSMMTDVNEQPPAWERGGGGSRGTSGATSIPLCATEYGGSCGGADHGTANTESATGANSIFGACGGGGGGRGGGTVDGFVVAGANGGGSGARTDGVMIGGGGVGGNRGSSTLGPASDGSDGPDGDRFHGGGGGGGGGGAADNGVYAGNGGHGGIPGGGGGGGGRAGGGTSTIQISGRGGNGARGEIVIETYS